MEDMPGGSLAERLTKVTPGTAAFSAADAVQLGTQIADGLQALHARGYVHGDLQPANIFLDEQGHVKLGGLGKAKMPGYSFDLFPAPLRQPRIISARNKKPDRRIYRSPVISMPWGHTIGLLSGRVYSRQQPVTKVAPC